MFQCMVGKYAISAVVLEWQPVSVQVQAQIATSYLVDVHKSIVLQPHRVSRMLNNLQGATVLHRVPSGYEVADPDDAWLLALADTACADYVVTGDKRSGLLAERRIGIARIMTAAAFCKVFE
jgi:predicted nucleic acid-binding protein